MSYGSSNTTVEVTGRNVSTFMKETPVLSPLPKHLDNYDIWIKVTLTIVTAPLVIFSMFAIVALNRTRRTPASARFLSSGLILFDTLAVTCFSFRRFALHHGLNISLQVIGILWCFLAYVTIGVMSLERFILFHSPNFYLRHLNYRQLRYWVIGLWVTVACIYMLVRYGLCYITFPDATIYSVLNECNAASFAMFGTGILFVIVVSSVCYLRIFLIVRSDTILIKASPTSFVTSTRSLRSYQSTSIVAVYLVIIITTSLAWIIILLQGLDTQKIRVYSDIINITNCMLDPCMYVVWFSECKMELLKILAYLVPQLRPRIEKMRFEIFQVVTMDTGNTAS